MRKNYICTACNFRFKAEKIQKECPWCGRECLEKEKNAAELLDEVNNILRKG